MQKKRLFSYVEVTDDVPLQKLTLKDQLRFIIRKITYDPKSELATEDAETIYLLQLKANLLELIQKATEPIRKGMHTSVTIAVSSKFEPVFDEVLESDKITNFYTVSVSKHEIGYDIPYFMETTLTVKTR